MKKLVLFLTVVLAFLSCNQPVEKTRGIPAPERVKKEAPVPIDSLENDLKEKGYHVFRHETEDSTYLMQRYYMVFLKAGPNRNQDSTEAAKLQEQHLSHLSRMADEGFASLVGPLEGNDEIRGIAIYNTPTQKEADSLANLDPMVKAGRLKVEVHPWWTSKGGKLD